MINKPYDFDGINAIFRELKTLYPDLMNISDELQ